MAVEWLNEEELLTAEKLYTFTLESLPKFQEYLVSDNPKLDWPLIYSSRVWEFSQLGVYSWLLFQDAEQSRDYFQSAAEAGIEMMKEWRKKPKSSMSEKALEVLERALASGNMEQAKNAAKLFFEPDEYAAGHPTVRIYTGAIRGVVLEDQSYARKYIEKLPSATKKLPCQTFGKLFLALFEGDEDAVRKEFKTYIQWFRKKVKPERSQFWSPETGWVEHNLIPFEHLLSVPGIGICNLLATRGIEIEVDEPFLPRQVLAY